MSCKLVARNQSADARPLTLQPLPAVAPAGAATPELDQARVALVQSTAEAERLHQHIAELEQALAAREKLGFEKGFAEGQLKGRQESAEEMQPALARVARAIADTAMLRARLRMDSEAGLVRLCAAIARRILKRELHMDPLAMEGIVHVSLARVGAAEIFKVRVHPNHVAAIRTQLSKLGVPESVTVDGAASLEEGDLLIETSAGELDASIKTQIGEVERGLATAVAS